MSYPVHEVIPALKDELRKNRSVILQAPPGAGKSTIVPLELLQEPWLRNKKIVMLEPRRLAARSVAMRMAFLLNEEPGQQVGYRIRFENQVGDLTRIEVVTEGILTRMLQSDNALEEVGLVIFDEFHERSLHADLALALCLQAQHLLRDDLRILIMSATLDGERISEKLNGAPIVSSSGKQFPVEVKYLSHPPDTNSRIPVQVAKAIQRALREEQGDILAFLPGSGEIKQTHELLQESELNCVVHPLYGDLPFKKQQEAILPDSKGRRKIVLATSIAETSLTIEGVHIVIDSGYSRLPRFDPRSGLSKLETVPITRDAANQRMGRAGRLAPGVCYRLWTEAAHRNLLDHRKPEILEADLAPFVLELCAWGVTKIDDLTLITQPASGSIEQAYELLKQLDAVNSERKITARGKEMAKLPTHPRIAHMLLECGNNLQKLQLAIDIAALLEERDPLPRDSGSDIGLRIAALRRWRSGERVGADVKILSRMDKLAGTWRKLFRVSTDNSTRSDYEAGELIALAYPDRIAKQTSRHSDQFKLANSRIVKVQEHDALIREPWLAVAHLDSGVNQGKIFLAAPVDEQQLHQLAHEHVVVKWDKEREMVLGVAEQRIGNLVLTSKVLQSIPKEERINVLCQVIRDNGLGMIGWSEKHQAWQTRVLNLKLWRPEEKWPDVSDQFLLSNLEEWLAPYLEGIKKRTDFQMLALDDRVAALLPWEYQSKLEKLAPEKIEVPSGSKIPVKYFPDGRAPVLEVRLQEVFGLLDTPVINEGRTKIQMHLLSPGYKPVQVTQDLRSFWQTAYHEVRKELRRRYPKHSWPEDPWTAKALRGAIKKRS